MIGTSVVYIDSMSKERPALVTKDWGNGTLGLVVCFAEADPVVWTRRDLVPRTWSTDDHHIPNTWHPVEENP